MRTVSYKCDRCGKAITSRTAVKLNTTLQRGNEGAEKHNFDFCNKCFLSVKKAWAAALTMDSEEPSVEEPAAERKAEPKTAYAPDKIDRSTIPGLQRAAEKDSSRVMREMKEEQTVKPEPKPELVKEPVKEPVQKPVKEQAEEQDERKRRGRKPKPVELPVPGEDGMVSGPINAAEKAEFLRLYVDEGLEIEKIAARMHRLVKGVKRAIHAMEKSGEMDEFRRKLDAEREPEVKDEAQSAIHNLLATDDEEEDVNEANTGSGASNSGVSRDSYTGSAQTTVIDGKRYDVGGILALYKAGWKTKDIANERNYDEDVVRLIIEEHHNN